MKDQSHSPAQETTGKRKYNRPELTEVEIDHEISMVMMSANPYEDPEESIRPENFNLNPFKMLRF